MSRSRSAAFEVDPRRVVDRPAIDPYDVDPDDYDLDALREIRPDEHPGVPSDPPPAVERSPILRDVIWKRVHEKRRNFMLAVIGGTGSGKSYAAQRLAEVLDPGYRISQTAFGLENFFELVEADYPPGSVVVMEEGGVAASHRDWYEDANKHLNRVLQTWRHQSRIGIITLPELDKLDSAARPRLHAFARMVELDHHNRMSKAVFKRIKVLRGAGESRVIYPYPRVRWNGSKRVVKGLSFGLPSPELQRQYEARKQAYTAKLNAEALDDLREDDEDEELSPDEVADEILSSGVDPYISSNGSQEYVDRDFIEMDYGVSSRDSKKVKKLLLRRLDRDLL